MRRGCPDMFRVSCEGISRGPPRVFVWWVVILSTESPNVHLRGQSYELHYDGRFRARIYCRFGFVASGPARSTRRM